MPNSLGVTQLFQETGEMVISLKSFILFILEVAWPDAQDLFARCFFVLFPVYIFSPRSILLVTKTNVNSLGQTGVNGLKSVK